MQMLLFYGSNTTLSTSSFSKFDPKGHDNNPLTSSYPTIPKGPINSGGQNPGVSVSSGGSTHTHTIVDSNKQRKLEERMGPGGLGYQTGVQKSQSHPRNGTGKSVYRGKNSYKPCIIQDLYGEPALHFSGNQQFFFRFIVQMDNHRFCRCLEEAIAAEIKDLTQLCDADTNTDTGINDVDADNSVTSSSNNQKNNRKNNSRINPTVSADVNKSSSSSSSSSTTSTSTSFETATDVDEVFSSSTTSFSPSSSSSHKKSFLQDNDLEGLSTFDSKQYSSTIQSFAFRIVKLRMLGRFLGLITFWPTWSLQVNPRDFGPLILLARNAARSRGSLRSSTAYPLKNILEQAWIKNRLAYTVPWVAEFLKLIVWDCTYVQAQNPYREVFGLLRSMQRNKLLHPVEGKPSSNRLYVLIEIQNLWSAVPLRDIHIIPLPIIKNEKNGKTDFRSNNGFEIDDENGAFTLNFLNHVTLFLNEALNLFKKRKVINLAKRISQGTATATSTSSSSSSFSSSSSLSSSSSIPAVQFSNTKRQTPNLIGLLNSTSTTNDEVLHSFGAIQKNSFSPQCIKSPTSTIKKTYGIPYGPSDVNRIPVGTPVNNEERVGSSGGRVATSLLAQFTAASASTPSASTSFTTTVFTTATTATTTAVHVHVPVKQPRPAAVATVAASPLPLSQKNISMKSDLMSLEDRMTRSNFRNRSNSTDHNHVQLIGVSTNNAGSSSNDSTVKTPKNRICPVSVLKKTIPLEFSGAVQTVHTGACTADNLVTPSTPGALIEHTVRNVPVHGPELGPKGSGPETGMGSVTGTKFLMETDVSVWNNRPTDLTSLTDR